MAKSPGKDPSSQSISTYCSGSDRDGTSHYFGSNEDGLSSDEAQQVHQQAEVTSSDVAETQESSTEYPSLVSHGPLVSAGSSLHPHGCKPCAYFCFSMCGCREGDACSFCHLNHVSGTRKKKEAWKKDRAERTRKKVPSQPTRCQEPPNTKVFSKDSRMVQQPPIQQAPVSSVCPSVQPEQRLGGHDEHMAHLYDLLAADDRMANLRNLLAVCKEEQNQGIGVRSGAVAAVPGPLPISREKDSARFSLVDSHRAFSSPSPACPKGVSPNTFSYSQREVVASVWQKIHLFPLTANRVPLVFAVAPELPSGLTIDKFSGVISGIPQRPTDGPATYFVTSCEPQKVNNVKVACVHINVIVGPPGLVSGGPDLDAGVIGADGFGCEQLHMTEMQQVLIDNIAQRLKLNT